MSSDREKHPQVWGRVAASLLLLVLCTSCATSEARLTAEVQSGIQKMEDIGDARVLRGVKKWLKTSLRKNNSDMIWGSLCPMDLINELRSSLKKKTYLGLVYFL